MAFEEPDESFEDDFEDYDYSKDFVDDDDAEYEEDLEESQDSVYVEDAWSEDEL